MGYDIYIIWKYHCSSKVLFIMRYQKWSLFGLLRLKHSAESLDIMNFVDIVLRLLFMKRVCDLAFNLDIYLNWN